MFHLRFGLSDHLKALLDFVFGSRRRVKKVRIFRAWFSQKKHMPRGKKRWKTKEGTYQLKHPEDGEQTEQTMPTADEATFAEISYHYSLSHDGDRFCWETTCDGSGRASWRFQSVYGPVGTNRSSAAGVDITPAPVSAACQRIYPTTTSEHHTSLLWQCGEHLRGFERGEF